MTKSTSVYHSMRMLCTTPDFGDQLFGLLTPLDLSAFLYAFNTSITRKQSRIYMQFWRQIFTDKSWLLWILSHGFEVSFVGNDLITMVNWVRNPGLMNRGRRKLYLDLNLVSCVASRRYRLSSLENFDFVIREKNKHFREFARNDNFNKVLPPGVYAKYAELIMGRELCDDQTMPYVWLDLTITSAVKYKAVCEFYEMGRRADYSISTGLWYGDQTMQKWQPPNTGSSAIDMGVLLKVDHAFLTNMPMDSVSKFCCINKVVGKIPSTGAYLFQQQNSFDCTKIIEKINV